MADFENNVDVSGKPKSSSVFNRSVTLQTTQATTADSQPKPILNSSLYRIGSINRFYNSIESVVSAGNSIKGKVRKLCSIFESPKSPQLSPNESQSLVKLKSMKSLGPEYRVPSIFNYNSSIRLPGTEDRIVMYFTSLRGIRRTYEDCYAVRMIFRGFRVWVDERDISMDSAYKKELQSVLGQKNVSLPQVFIRGKYMGGADVIKQMFEVGELAKIMAGFPVQKPGLVCEFCGDARFVPCANCSGSRKVFDEDEGLLKRCLECNENGLIRCPDCCS